MLEKKWHDSFTLRVYHVFNERVRKEIFQIMVYGESMQGLSNLFSFPIIWMIFKVWCLLDPKLGVFHLLALFLYCFIAYAWQVW